MFDIKIYIIHLIPSVYVIIHQSKLLDMPLLYIIPMVAMSNIEVAHRYHWINHFLSLISFGIIGL